MRNKLHKKLAIFSAARGRCSYCGVHLTLDEATLDHWKPRAEGGKNANTNLRIACVICNRAKGRLQPNVFLAWLDRLARRKPERNPMRAVIGRDVIVLGIESNGAMEHPAKLTRVWADDDTVDTAILVNLTVFPDCSAPRPQGSVLLFDKRDQAQAHRAGNPTAIVAFWPERV